MIGIEKKTVYEAFGLTVSSEIPLPELLHIKIEGDITDIVIEKADLYPLWNEHSDPNEDFVINKEWIMFHVSGTAIFLIQSGNRIVVSPVNGAYDDEIRLYILGTCMGAILMQRKILPIHGSAVAIDGKAYAIVGDSGAGKSTLASALLKRGYQLISDDVIPVTLTNENVPFVTPSYPQQKLWLESLNHFEMDSTNYQSLTVRENKFAIPVQNQFVTEPLPLAGVFELVKGDNDEIEVKPIEHLQRFYKLYYHTYRNSFIQQSGLMDWHFNTSAKMIKKIDFYQLRRPTNRFTAPELSDLIVNMLKMEEIVHD
ncbi:HPr kinase/phosphorylase [Peribacillus sp. TH24]|uniref:HPr kinase/phosphorylase n=1 Tax=Peribacillus sp. TH24 TaxID=2798483 RepID=UPI0019128589|nr:ATP-binding cassette domain-containing protein [Peribacillus sp. TH24]MBK5442688.1 ATP-binding cassette domain-containing protein [Peribacillus sp. TH24]